MAGDIEAALRETVARLARDPRVRYAEVRFTDESVEAVRVHVGKQRSDGVSTTRSRGVGVRVLGAKTWGFACTARTDAASIAEAAERAAAIAHASSALATRVAPFPEREAQRGTWATRVAIDPFAISLGDRLAAIERPALALLGGAVASAEAHVEFRRIEKRLLTTEGTDVSQTIVEGACNMQAIATGDAAPAMRTYPTWRGCDAFQGGWEGVTALALETHAPRVRDEAIALLAAPVCPEGVSDVILESSQVALQIHESCGHPTELDRTMGTEITLAGGSFLDAEKLGSFRYGSEHVTITAGSTAVGGCGSFGWDDEGTPAGEHVLVDRGVLVDFLSSRETAAAIGRASTGTMRAQGWDRTPLIRMTNVSLAADPRGPTLEELVADTKRGIYIATDRSWSIDDQRLDFQFSCELAWEIVNGKRTRLLRSPLYAGRTPAFWASCDAVCAPSEHRLWGIASCGKGDPIQIVSVGHGASPARFRGVRVGSPT
ncbi:MAG TPA: TldD/PmbA family protein [Labilithrix sp.]